MESIRSNNVAKYMAKLWTDDFTLYSNFKGKDIKDARFASDLEVYLHLQL